MTKEQEKEMISQRLETAAILQKYAEKEVRYVRQVIRAWEKKHQEKFAMHVKG